jgi:hypothetical protein
MSVATCAKCGEKRDLCDSGWVAGIKQPRICKDCLLKSMETGDDEINDLFWIVQLSELDDKESLEAIGNLVKSNINDNQLKDGKP